MSTIDTLNALLKIEHTAANLYATQGNCAAFAGYSKLAEKLKAESEEERGHVAKLTERILQLGGAPVVEFYLIAATEDVQLMLEHGMELETQAKEAYNEAISGLLRGTVDHGTRIILDEIQRDTEGHILWLMQQQTLIERLGLQNYLATLI